MCFICRNISKIVSESNTKIKHDDKNMLSIHDTDFGAFKISNCMACNSNWKPRINETVISIMVPVGVNSPKEA